MIPKTQLDELQEAILEASPPVILVVDDTKEIRSALTRILAPDGYVVHEAENGAVGFQLAESERPDLILTDVMMPVMSGLELCRNLRAQPDLAEIPLMMITALDDHESRLKGFEAGADDFLSKPFDPGELRSRVRVITRLNRYRKLVSERFQSMYVDRLTGLENRWRFIERADTRLAGERPERWGLFVVSLTHFRRTNETFGSRVGDRLLQLFAQRLKSVAGADALVARVSGAEFAILTSVPPGTSSLQARSVELRNQLGGSYEIDPLELRVHVRVGAARSESATRSGTDLLQAGDVALARARERAERVALFEPSMLNHVMRFVATATELEKALERDQIVPLFQPIVKLESGEVVGVESLVRWRTASGVLRPPSEFLSVAEETGLISQIDQIMLDASLAALGQWTRAFPACGALTMSLNVSARTLGEGGLIGKLVAAAERHDVDLARVRVELTESSLLGDMQARIAEFEQLRALGVGVRIDDFGTGYSSLSYLSQLPIEALKIDRAFVEHMLSRSKDRAVATTVLELARTLGFGTIAEGIEHAEQSEALLRLGCEYGQGYLFGRPLEGSLVPGVVMSRRPSHAKVSPSL
jgi:diguanylate cyclase (GGDEF)-like protein